MIAQTIALSVLLPLTVLQLTMLSVAGWAVAFADRAVGKVLSKASC